MTDLLRELIEFVKDASPEVWRILLKQAYVDAAGAAIWAIGLLAATVALYKLTRYGIQRHEEDSYSMWDLGATFSGVTGAISAILAIANLISVFQKFLNPEFYAVRFILQQLGGG